MASVSTATSEFYHQLGLLLRSGLPLPESLTQLASGLSSAKLQRAIAEAGAETSGGGSLTEILGRHPDIFDPFLVRLLKVGEESETLPGMLFTVAQLARFEQFLVATLRGALSYPVLVIHVALLVVLGASFFILPVFGEILGDLDQHDSLPALTAGVLAVGRSIVSGGGITILLYLVFLAATIWLFTPSRAAHNAMASLVNFMPGTWKISATLHAARVSQMLGRLMSRDVPASEAMRFAGQMAARPRQAIGLLACADQLDRGVPFKQAIETCSNVDELIRLTVRHSPEESLPSELIGLGELYEHRVMLSAKNVAGVWTAATLIGAIFCVFIVIMSLFLPLRQLVLYFGYW